MMRVERTPYTVYDFLGYFTPGFMFLVMFSYSFKKSPINYFVNQTNISTSVTDDIILIIYFLFLSFVCGHIISFLSHRFHELVTCIFKCRRSDSCFLRQLNRKMFDADSIDAYLKKYCETFKSKRTGIKLETLVKDKKYEKIAKMMMLGISNDNISNVIYNMLVISGMFRAVSMAFFLYSGIMIFFYEFFREDLVFSSASASFFWITIIISLFMGVISFMIFCKYLRRYIEKIEAAIVLKDIGFLEEDKNNSKRPSK